MSIAQSNMSSKEKMAWVNKCNNCKHTSNKLKCTAKPRRHFWKVHKNQCLLNLFPTISSSHQTVRSSLKQMHAACCCCCREIVLSVIFRKMLLVVYLPRSLRTLRTLLWSCESKLPWRPWESFWMGWLTLTGEADTDITAGSPRAFHACWDKSPILTMKVKLSSTKKMTHN